jgi:hypothetical protein
MDPLIKATKRWHQASTCSDSINRTRLPPILGGIFHHQIIEKELKLP